MDNVDQYGYVYIYHALLQNRMMAKLFLKESLIWLN